MTIDIIRGLITLTLIILFAGIWIWAWSAKREPGFSRASRLPLDENDGEGSNS